MKSYMGLDLGTSLGWGRLDIASRGGLTWAHGTWDCSITENDGRGLRYVKFKNRLSSHLALGVDTLFYEHVRRHAGTIAAQVYGGFLSTMQETCDEFGVPYKALEVGQIKRFATGKGNASKAMMVEACRMWGFEPDSEDAADALCITRYGWEMHT